MFLFCKSGWPISARTRRTTSSKKASLYPISSSTFLLLICPLKNDQLSSFSHLTIKLSTVLGKILWSRSSIDELLFVFQSQSSMCMYLSLGLLFAKACLANSSIQIRVVAMAAKVCSESCFLWDSALNVCRQYQAENTHRCARNCYYLPPKWKRKCLCVSF